MKAAFFRVSRTIVLATAILAGTWSISFAQSKIPGYLSVGGWIDGQYSYELQENNAITELKRTPATTVILSAENIRTTL